MIKKSIKQASKNRRDPRIEKKVRIDLTTFTKMCIILDHDSNPYKSSNEFMRQAIIQKVNNELKKYE